MTLKVFLSASLFTTIAFSSAAAAQHADMLLIRDQQGNLLTGQYSFDQNLIIDTDTRVYEGEFDTFGVSDEPGFNALSASNIPDGFNALDGNTAVSFTANAFAVGGATANLFYWDGHGDVDFVTSTNTLTVSKAPSNVFSSLLDGSDSDVAGFDIEATSADGFLHKHIDFALSDISNNAGGFYLWAFTLHHGSDSADSIFFVHGFDTHDENAHEAAVDWVNTNLVPAPGSLSALLGLAAMVTRRRR